MKISDRSASLRKRILESRFAERADDILAVARGEKPLTHGMNVEVERAIEGKRAPNGDSYHVKINASTDGIARDCGIIPMDAWQHGGLRNFAQNPIILAFHSHKDPIGRSVHTELAERSMVQYWQFHEETELSRTMKALYEKGFMRAASVGFLVHEFAYIDELDDKELEDLIAKYGTAVIKDAYWIARKAELLETSAVPVPSDPKALAFSFAARSASAVGIEVPTEVMKHTAADTSQRETDMDAEAIKKAAEDAARALVEAAQKEAKELVDAARKAATDEITALRGEITKLIDRLAAVETRGTSTDTGTPAGGSADEVPELRDGEVAIELKDGEDEAAAVSRYVDEVIASKRGAPAPKQK